VKEQVLGDCPRRILSETEIKPGQIWSQCDGSGGRACVHSVADGWVVYRWVSPTGTVDALLYEKDVFSFQVRYRLDEKKEEELR
jgi:hypothetical protein